MHFYLIRNVESDKQDAINQMLTGPLDQFKGAFPGQPEQDTEATTPQRRPPAWSHIPMADIKRMAELRAAQAQAEQQG